LNYGVEADVLDRAAPVERWKRDRRNTLREKRLTVRKIMDSNDLPRVEEIPDKMQKALGSGTLAIPSPREVE